jgi:hypothetical protein
MASVTGRARFRKALAVSLGLLGLLALAAGPAGAQCVMCKTALTNSPEGRSIGEQFNRAILLMIVAPYLLVGSFAVLFFRRRLGRRLGALAARLRAAMGVPAVPPGARSSR